MERACFDYIMIEDTLMVSDAYGGTSEAYLKHAHAWRPSTIRRRWPRSWPPPRRKLGVVATMSTTFYPPFMLARLVLDARPHRRGPLRLEHRHLRRGRLGAELRHGQARRARPALRHGRRVRRPRLPAVGLVGAGRGGAATARPAPTPTSRRCTPINFEGKYFKCRGPLNTARSPQGRPTFVQAGGSPRGPQVRGASTPTRSSPSPTASRA